MTAEPAAVIVLAAGASRRYGGIKLLADAGNGETLLGRSVRVALEAGLGPVLVVLGGHARELRRALEGSSVEIVHNPAWREGMGRSLAAGIAAVGQHHPDAAGAVVAPADLPHLSAAHLARLPELARQSGRPMAATAGPAGLLQAPACFSRELFPRLQALRGDRGARDILRTDPSAVATLEPSFPFEDLDFPHPEGS
ncbi:MAG: nucleotidyltransferase family protein [Acidobacteria bacterium]|nr:nucleotidyltransferase family protein [Acidobacteriota bacterium]